MTVLEKSCRQLQLAEEDINQMISSASFDEYEKSWISFLHNLERCWNKYLNEIKLLEEAHDWSEIDNFKNKRKTDEVLLYLRNARGADEHTVANITQKTQCVSITNPTGGPVIATIEGLFSSEGHLNVNIEHEYEIKFNPDKMKLLPVVNRGRTYKPPFMYPPENIAKKGISLYNKLFVLTDKKFCANVT